MKRRPKAWSKLSSLHPTTYDHNRHQMKLLSKIRKEVTVGFGAALNATGIKKIEEDPDFTARDQRLQEISSAVNSLLSEFDAITRSIKNISVARDTIASRLASPAPSGSTILTLAEGLTGDQLPANCVRPLQEYRERLVLLDNLRKKRRRNKLLAESGSGPEQARRQEKYDTFHRAFLRGVDLAVAHWPTLLALVFGAEYLHLIRFVVAVSQNVGVVARASADLAPPEGVPLYPPPPDAFGLLPI
jgi:hypothetical protein